MVLKVAVSDQCAVANTIPLSDMIINDVAVSLEPGFEDVYFVRVGGGIMQFNKTTGNAMILAAPISNSQRVRRILGVTTLALQLPQP